MREVSWSMKTLFMEGFEKKEMMKKRGKKPTTTASPRTIRPKVGGGSEAQKGGDGEEEREEKGDKEKPAQQLKSMTPSMYRVPLKKGGLWNSLCFALFI